MFEKEEDYRKAREESKDRITKVIKVWSGREEAIHDGGFEQGAEFGYSKANEWHFVKDGDLPKDEEYKWCVSQRGYPYVARYEELFVSWTNRENKEVMCPFAWKEIVLPKEIE